MNTQLEKKFEEYHTQQSDRQDIRKVFDIADDERKVDIINHIDMILLKFNEIHEETLRKQLEIIEQWTQDILADLSIFINNQKFVDVLAELD